MHCMGCQTLENDAPSFLCPPSNLDEVWTETVHTCGVESGLGKPQAGWVKVSHSGDDWVAVPSSALSRAGLVLPTGLARHQDPEPDPTPLAGPGCMSRLSPSWMKSLVMG